MSKLTDIRVKIDELVKNLVELEAQFDDLNTEDYTNDNKNEIDKEYKIKYSGFMQAIMPMKERAQFMLEKFDKLNK